MSTERRVDELLVKISGKVRFHGSSPIDEDVRIVTEGRVVKTETLSNQDGSVNLVFVVKPTAANLEEN